MGHYIRQELSQFSGLVSNSFLRELKTNCLDCVGLRDEITEKCCIYFKSTLLQSLHLPVALYILKSRQRNAKTITKPYLFPC